VNFRFDPEDDRACLALDEAVAVSSPLAVSKDRCADATIDGGFWIERDGRIGP
jgi:hypothetical protein